MEVTQAHLRPILREIGRPDAVSLCSLSGGSSPAWRVDLADGEQLVLKCYVDEQRWRNGKEAFASRLLAGLPIPITRYLVMDGSRQRLPLRFSLANYLPGATLHSLLGHPDIKSAFRQTGALLRQLHSVRLPAYGSFGSKGLVRPVMTNAEFVRGIIGDALERFEHYGGEASLTQRLRTIIEARFDAVVPHSCGAVFAHDDIHPNNVLAIETSDGHLRLSGLIDFGNAQAADAVWDLAKALFCSIHEAPDSRQPMLEGYGPIDHPDPEGALWTYTLLHRLIMWSWLRNVGTIPEAHAPSALMDDLKSMAETTG
jgi:Ser/Thr protein kinase RdoA (MazF antagonist)